MRPAYAKRSALPAHRPYAGQPDARTMGWRQKETATASRLVPLQGAGTAQVRAMLLAEKWQMPRVFEPGGRHEAMLAGLTEEEKRARVGKIAKGLGHWAIPLDLSRGMAISA